MRGSIRKRRGAYLLTVEVAPRDENGKRQQKFVTVRGTKRDAERKLREVLHALETGTYVEQSRITVA